MSSPIEDRSFKVGVIADIHSDVEALSRALGIFQNYHVDQIVCAGDIVDKGPDNAATVQLLRQTSVHCIAGNHDHDEQYIGSLDDDTANYLRELPESRSFLWENQRVLLAHASPWSDFVRILPTTERHVFKRIAREANADIVILGHTHIPLVAQVDNTWIFNPGSVCGIYSSGSRTCGILTLPENDFEVFRLDSGLPLQITSKHIY